MHAHAVVLHLRIAILLIAWRTHVHANVANNTATVGTIIAAATTMGTTKTTAYVAD